jgi:TolB-like protein
MRKLTVLITMLVGVMFNVVANETVVQGKKVAVLPFAVKGNLDALYAEVAQDNFVTELAKSKMYQIVVRSQVDKAMKDLNIQGGNDIDESAAMEIGKVAGAEIIVIGGITALNSQFVVNIRGINVNSGTTEFADKGIVNSQGELLVAIEGISKKFAGSNDYTTPNYNTNTWNNQNYATNNFYNQNNPNQSPAMDFSINRNATLREWEEYFIEKYFLGKWGIDPRDTPQVYKKYKKYLGGGIALSVVGGITAAAGVIMMGVGFNLALDYASNPPETPSLSHYDSSEWDDYDRAVNRWEVDMWGSYAVGAVGSVLFTTGFILATSALGPYLQAYRIKRIHRKVTGQRSFNFTPRVSTTGGFNGESKLEIALGCNF